MIEVIQILSLSAAIAVLWRCIYIAGHIGLKDFEGHPVRFLILASGYALAAVGAMGFVFGWTYGATFMLIGVAVFMLAERRLGVKRVSKQPIHDH